ncbi:MAG: hypothetical protein LAP85_06995 [Acidobacteriia bacterium]|nr:hypothetical protein [Terriglobia bacterium]
MTLKSLPQTLSQDTASCLYRVMQESLRNAARHARTQRISVSLTGSARDLSLSVRDWGVGFNPEILRAGRGGLGIVGMKERARLVNGTLHLHSRPGQGTQVVVRLPLAEVRQ